MRQVLAATCFVWAAFDWPTFALDRGGVALIGLAFLALAIRPAGIIAPAPPPAGFGRAWADLNLASERVLAAEPEPWAVDEPEPELHSDAEPESLTARLAAYSERT